MPRNCNECGRMVPDEEYDDTVELCHDCIEDVVEQKRCEPPDVDDMLYEQWAERELLEKHRRD